MYHVIDQINLFNNVHSDDPKLNKKNEGRNQCQSAWVRVGRKQFSPIFKILIVGKGPREPPCIVKFESCFKIKLLMLISLMECLYLQFERHYTCPLLITHILIVYRKWTKYPVINNRSIDKNIKYISFRKYNSKKKKRNK